MKEYKTQMEAARKGILTEELKTVAEKERMTPEELLPLVASGRVAICANKNHKCIDPEGVGSMLSTCHYGSVLPRRHGTVPAEADFRMPGDDRYRTSI